MYFLTPIIQKIKLISKQSSNINESLEASFLSHCQTMFQIICHHFLVLGSLNCKKNTSLPSSVRLKRKKNCNSLQKNWTCSKILANKKEESSILTLTLFSFKLFWAPKPPKHPSHAFLPIGLSLQNLSNKN